MIALTATIAELAALLLGFVLLLLVGGLGGIVLGLALVLGMPILVAFLFRRFLQARLQFRLLLVAAPVWIGLALMTSFFTSFGMLVTGDAVRWGSVAALALAAGLGAALGVRIAPVEGTA